MAEPILSTQGLSRSFGALMAVDRVSLSVPSGAMLGLIGPNGAGKSTLFNLLTGTLKPDSGEVRLDGAVVTGATPDQLFRRGLGRSFQIPRPFARMSVLENLILAPPDQRGETLLGAIFGDVRAEEARLRDQAMEILEFITLAPLADHPAGKLSGGQLKLLELARVLMGGPNVILLDEPAAGVTPALTETLIEKIEALNARGTTFVIIEHDMDFVMRHCTPIVALAEGRIVFEGTPEAALSDPALLDAYLGAPVDG